MTALLWFALALCVLGLAWVALWALGAMRWASAIRTLTGQLESARTHDPAQPAQPKRYDARELQGLPAPVQRYFRAVLKDGQALIGSPTIELAGTFNMSPSGEQWKRFTSTQRAITRRPGFLWDAKVAMFPGVPLRVVDAYIAGEGKLRAAVLGLFTVADVHGSGEIARGELMRWFAEAVWYPTALLPSQGVRWEAVDDTSANASIVDGPITLMLLFGFDAEGLIATVRAAARGAGVGKDGVMLMLPWECALSDYRPQHGMLLPMVGEAAWLRPEGRKPYFVGTVSVLKFEFSP
jgi:hypothetical protein